MGGGGGGWGRERGTPGGRRGEGEGREGVRGGECNMTRVYDDCFMRMVMSDLMRGIIRV